MDYYKLGHERGAAAGSWVIDGNTSDDVLRRIVAGYDEGDPEIMDLAPAPLSGEWAGESISEIFGIAIHGELPHDDDLTEYENGFSVGFWESLIGDCLARLGVAS